MTLDVDAVFAHSNGDDTAVIVSAGPWGSPGTSRQQRDQFALLGATSADHLPQDFGSAYAAIWGNAPAGSIIYGEVIPVDSVTGQQGVPIEFRTIVAV